MFAFEVYRSDRWHEPLEIDAEIEERRLEDITIIDKAHYKTEVYEAWYHDSRVLTMHMLNETLTVSEEVKRMVNRRDIKIPVGEVAFVMARFPTLIRTLEPDDSLNNSYITNNLSYLRTFTGRDEAFAWYLMMRNKGWKWGEVESANIMYIAREIHEGGVSFDQAQPYISAGVYDSGTVIEAVKNDIDVGLLVGVSEGI